MKDEILVLSNAGDDAHTELVTDHLDRMREKYFRFNTEDFPTETGLSMEVDGIDFTGELTSVDGTIDVNLNKVKSVWDRRPVPPQADRTLYKGYQEFVEGESKGALWALYTTLDAFWLNPPIVTKLLEHNKPYQIRESKRVGLSAPDTIITNNPARLCEFTEQHGGTIAIKPLRHSYFSQEETNATEVVFTTPVSIDEIREHLDEISLAPIMAQAYIPKKLEFRVTIVGDKIFPCAIYSQDSEKTKHDWRNYDFEKVKHEEWTLPDDVNFKLLRLMKRLGLSYGGVDMILTPSGEYVFLEVNPSGQWHWTEKLTGMPISRAIAELLANPPT